MFDIEKCMFKLRNALARLLNDNDNINKKKNS